MQTHTGAELTGLGLLSFLCALGCADNPAAGAVTATGIAVAGSAINRAVTKDCWARCSQGWVCNQESGLCERGECTPSCAPGYACTRTRTGNTCLAEGAPLSDPVGDPTRADRLGPRGVRGDPLAPKTPEEENLAHPERNEGGQVTIARGDPGVPEPSSQPTADNIRKVPHAEYEQRGRDILEHLDSLVTAWGPRLGPPPNDFPTRAFDPPGREFGAYTESLHKASLHDVYSRGFLTSLDELSKTHALSNLALEVTVVLSIAQETGALQGVFLLKSSGSELFDVGSLETIAQAAPFPPPPPALIDATGNLRIKMRLFRHPDYACSAAFVDQLTASGD